MTALGYKYTLVVDEDGVVWGCGKNALGQLGLGNIIMPYWETAEYIVPEHVGGSEVFRGRVDMVATGSQHSAALVADGSLYTWGHGYCGQLGHGNREEELRPRRLDKTLFGASRAAQVACGYSHTVVLTADGRVRTCGRGLRGQLGHRDTADKLVLTEVGVEHFKGKRIVMVAAGYEHNAAVGDDGSVFTWGCGDEGRLGHNDEEDRLLPTQVTFEAMGARVVMVATGSFHTVVVAHDGALWVWGRGVYGQLGLGDNDNRPVPTRVTLEAFGGSRVLMADCGRSHTLAVTDDGKVYSCGDGRHGKLGHNDENDRHVFTLIGAQHFGHKKIVTASAGDSHSSAVTEDGEMYTWGQSAGLGHGDGQDKWVPTLVPAHLLGGKRVGRYHSLLPERALALAMGTHPRLGSHDKCMCDTMPPELVQRVVEACQSWPEAQTGVRRLGGGVPPVNHST